MGGNMRGSSNHGGKGQAGAGKPEPTEEMKQRMKERMLEARALRQGIVRNNLTALEKALAVLDQAQRDSAMALLAEHGIDRRGPSPNPPPVDPSGSSDELPSEPLAK